MQRMKTLVLRPATVDDAEAISVLIADLMPYLTLAPDGAGAETFIASMSTEALAGLLADARYDYRLGHIGTELAGVVAIRDRRHLFHLFVARSFQGQGIGRRLWRAARNASLLDGGAAAFTVNASDYAMPVYQRFGFRVSGVRVARDGIAYTPMQLAAA